MPEVQKSLLGQAPAQGRTQHQEADEILMMLRRLFDRWLLVRKSKAAAAMARKRWADESHEQKREHALRMVKARKRRQRERELLPPKPTRERVARAR